MARLLAAAQAQRAGLEIVPAVGGPTAVLWSFAGAVQPTSRGVDGAQRPSQGLMG